MTETEIIVQAEALRDRVHAATTLKELSDIGKEVDKLHAERQRLDKASWLLARLDEFLADTPPNAFDVDGIRSVIGDHPPR